MIARFFKELLRRFDATVAYLRSFFDEPARPGKASMARLIIFLAFVAAFQSARWLVAYIRTPSPSTVLAGILGGFVLTFAVKTGVAMYLRLPVDSSDQDDAPTSSSPSTIVTTSVETSTASGPASAPAAPAAPAPTPETTIQ